MTTQQRATIAHIEASLEAQRENADYAARPALTLREQAESLYHAMMVAKAAGEIEKARALAVELKPLLEYLP